MFDKNSIICLQKKMTSSLTACLSLVLLSVGLASGYTSGGFFSFDCPYVAPDDDSFPVDETALRETVSCGTAKTNFYKLKWLKSYTSKQLTVHDDTGGRLNWWNDNIFSEIRLFVCIYFAVHKEP